MKKYLLCMILASFVLLLAGCGVQEEVSKQTERVPGEVLELTGKDFSLIASGDEMELLLDPSTATLRWQDKKTGIYRDTRIFDSSQTDVTLKSDLVMSFFTGTKSDRYKSYSTMDNFTYSVDSDGVTYEKLDNGVRVVYFIGNEKVSYKDFPAYISDERMNDLIIQYLDSKQMKTLKKQYRQLKSGDWSRTTNKDNPLSGLSASALYDIFYNVGHYTYEELEFDDTEFDKLDELPQRQQFEISMDYTLDGNDLVVHVNTAEMVYNEDYPIRNLSILPYFLSTTDTDGYLFVPDGSGALINLDNTKTLEYQFNSGYWNDDILQTATTYSTSASTMTAPVYGIKTSDCAILGIIEKGAEAATLSAYVKGAYNNIPYSRVSLSFGIREDQSLDSFVSALTNFTLKKVNTDYYSDDITLRYCFLTGDEADYSGMAGKYRDYLINRGDLKVNPVEEEAPVFVELLGYIDSTRYFLGIPYSGKTVITGFADAGNILSDMSSRGIKNAKIDYRGIANGGMLQRSAKKVRISSELGGEKGLSSLEALSRELGYELFPDLQLQTVTTLKGLSKKDISFFISGTAAQLYEFNLVSHTRDAKDKYPVYIISPTYIRDYVNSVDGSYSRLGLKNLASEDFYSFISADYRNKGNVSMTTAMPEYKAALKELSSSYRLMLSNPISEAWSDTTYITDLPVTGIELKVTDAYVPFLEMVFSGSTVYSTEVLNTNSFDMTKEMMKAMEYGSAMKFRFIAADIGDLQNTKADDIFLAEYDTLKEIVADLYSEYEGFYDRIAGARLVSHELLSDDGSVVRTEWSNGTVMYFNYSEEAAEADSIELAPMSYTYR